MPKTLRVAMAQINTLVGDIRGNTEQVMAIARRAQEIGAQVVVFPELTLSGYPPEDLLLRASMQLRVEAALERLRVFSGQEPACRGVDLVIGFPFSEAGKRYNMAAAYRDGACVARYKKQKLPNYQVFDEMRYFDAGDAPCVYEHDGVRIGITICEDMWLEGPVRQAAAAGAQVMLNLNASPFHLHKELERRELLALRAVENNLPIVYVNQVGGQDELVFDGGSMVMDRHGECRVSLPSFETALGTVDIACNTHCEVLSLSQAAERGVEATLYDALVLGVRDYVERNRFRGVVVGLSGGIDSALTLAIAADAIGPERVEAVMMPFRYTSDMSVEDAEAEARALGVRYGTISIEPMYDAFMAALADEFAGLPADTTEENLQARCRGVLLMAISNKKGAMVLSTGNKSEMAVGYSTLYGDLVGGFAVLKDVPKTMVFRLARYRNEIAPVIPERVISRPPSAELRPDQQDEDSLPPYDLLDAILELYIEKDCSADVIVAKGYDREVVHRVIRMVDTNEYKRRQAPIGVRISQRAFGRDRRYPITSGWDIADEIVWKEGGGAGSASSSTD